MTSATEFKGIAKSAWRRVGHAVYGMRTFGHKRDRLEDGPIACGSNPPGTFLDDAELVCDLIAEAGTVLHETGMGPRELAQKIQQLTAENEALRIHQGESLAAAEMSDRIKTLEQQLAAKPCSQVAVISPLINAMRIDEAGNIVKAARSKTE